MQFMCTWKLPPASYKQALARFLETGAAPPEGLKSSVAGTLPARPVVFPSLKAQKPR